MVRHRGHRLQGDIEAECLRFHFGPHPLHLLSDQVVDPDRGELGQLSLQSRQIEEIADETVELAGRVLDASGEHDRRPVLTFHRYTHRLRGGDDRRHRGLQLM